MIILTTININIIILGINGRCVRKFQHKRTFCSVHVRREADPSVNVLNWIFTYFVSSSLFINTFHSLFLGYYLCLLF